MQQNRDIQQIKNFIQVLPHCKVMQMDCEYFNQEEVCLTLPPQKNALGNADENLIHGGAITMLIDTSCGAMVNFTCNDEGTSFFPTLDLRVDHIKAATGDLPIHCKAKILKNTKRIVFASAEVFQDDKLIALATTTFIRVGGLVDKKTSKTDKKQLKGK